MSSIWPSQNSGIVEKIEIAENDQERPILITKGSSRDHRPDLKQCVFIRFDIFVVIVEYHFL